MSDLRATHISSHNIHFDSQIDLTEMVYCYLFHNKINFYDSLMSLKQLHIYEHCCKHLLVIQQYKIPRYTNLVVRFNKSKREMSKNKVHRRRHMYSLFL